MKFTMKTSVFLLLLIAAFTCGLAQEDDEAVEELLVETLVSLDTRVNRHEWNTMTATRGKSVSLLPIQGETRNLLPTFLDGRHAADPLHGENTTTPWFYSTKK